MFQFTHPGRGATVADSVSIASKFVSIHAPREGCDDQLEGMIGTLRVFQFTHPGRGATSSVSAANYGIAFQFTHPGRGATILRLLSCRSVYSFNSRTPGGVRRC